MPAATDPDAPSPQDPNTASARPRDGKGQSVRKAVILAAGIGDRLKPFTDHNPKCLVKVAGVPILENALTHLAALGTESVAIVVGHHKEIIIDTIGTEFRGMSICYVVSDEYETTNNIYSLWLARAHLDEDVLLLEADVFFERAILERLLSGEGTNRAVVSQHQSWMSGTVVAINSEGRIGALYDTQLQDDDFDYSKVYKTANLYLFRKDFLRRYFVPQLEAYVAAGDINDYYESILIALAHRGKNNLAAVVCDDLKWYEIDDESDRQAAEYMFSTPEQRYDHVSGLHGGYWRFGFVDHAYLYNAYYPPKTVFTHFKNHIRDLVLNYPVGQRVVARLVGTLINRPAEQVIVANGASELIKILAGRVSDRITCPVPSFNEYENASRPGVFSAFELPSPSFELDVDAFAAHAIAASAKLAVVVTPNNPTGLAVAREDVLRLAGRLADHDCMLVVDESFIDFAANSAELSVEDWVAPTPNLAVMKSLSKSFGIGGLRLGYLLTNNPKFAEAVRSQLHIWNINAFAESFLRQAPRHHRAFKASCARVRTDCDKLYAGLSEIPGVTAYPSQANFVLCRLPSVGPTSPEVAARIFVESDIFVKHCAGKPMPDADRYLRVASRTTPENETFVAALRSCLEA
ncbi:MAG: aminotransferase class I/II-fold pyridoxal phosphate-dependent enzyme [Nannocystaceae bacterium]|nr:aminotransferase class I/II-fold pyridoxal phosphate-dependent enzyme [Nannocystaceae bacterium]